jgi:hypothetical protein
MNISWLARDDLMKVAADKIIPTNIVLDVGAGIQPQTLFIPTVHMIVEPFVPYIEKLMNRQNEISRKVFLNGTWDKTMPLLPDRSVDTVFAFDVIEHFEKEDGLKFIKEAERVAKTQIAIFTPLGLYPQSYEPGNEIDRWGMGGGYWQSHRSGWEPKDFEGDWEFFVCKDFHSTDQHGEVLDQPFGAFWAIKTIENKTAPIEDRHHISELDTFFLIRYVYERIISDVKRKTRKLILKLKKKI